MRWARRVASCSVNGCAPVLISMAISCVHFFRQLRDIPDKVKLMNTTEFTAYWMARL
jgi:hypothetical protein